MASAKKGAKKNTATKKPQPAARGTTKRSAKRTDATPHASAKKADATPRAAQEKPAHPHSWMRGFDVEAALAKLPADDRVAPRIPVDTITFEARSVANAAREIAGELARMPGFDPASIDRVARLADALGEAEAAVPFVERPPSKRGPRLEAESLRRDLLAAGRYLLRDDRAAQALLDRVRPGRSDTLLAEGLYTLARFAEAYAATFARDPSLATAAARALVLADQLNEPTDRRPVLAALARRNGLLTLLLPEVAALRAAARYALRRDPDRLTPFRSDYERSRRRRRRHAASVAASAAKKPPPTPEKPAP